VSFPAGAPLAIGIDMYVLADNSPSGLSSQQKIKHEQNE
jgi:hypothetical protein